MLSNKLDDLIEALQTLRDLAGSGGEVVTGGRASLTNIAGLQVDPHTTLVSGITRYRLRANLSIDVKPAPKTRTVRVGIREKGAPAGPLEYDVEIPAGMAYSEFIERIRGLTDSLVNPGVEQ